MRYIPLVAVLLLGAAPQERAGGHPRLLFRAKATRNVPGLDEMVAKSKQAPWSKRLSDLKESTHGLALHWLITGDESSAKSCYEQLKEMKPDEGYGLYVQGPVFMLPIAYDWLYAWKGFTDKKAIEDKIVQTGASSMEFLKGRSDSVWHTSAPRAAMGVGLAGLALEGHHPKAAEFVKFTTDYLEKTYFPAMAHIDGGGVAGMSYAVHEGFAPLTYLLWALRSARDVDYFNREKWCATRVEYFIHQMLPDLTFQRWGDCVAGSRCGSRDETRGQLDMLARAHESPAAWALSARIAKRWPDSNGYHESVLPPWFIFGRETKEADLTLPLARMFGEKSIGQCFFRTGWGENDTVVFFKAGDYFDNHGHFDQGSFTIYRREQLAIDAGVYGDFDSDHRMKFARNTVAHNSVLIGLDDAGASQRIVNSQDSQDLADHEQKRLSRKLETADIVAWKTEGDYAYVSADLTAAYEPDRARLVTRELVWVRGALIVFDKVDTPHRARWLLHAAGDLESSGARFAYKGKTATLHGVSLLPKKPKIKSVRSNSVDGVEIQPTKTGEFAVGGGDRVEVEGGPHFLHVLFALDSGQEPPAVKLVEEGDVVGVELGGRKFLFKKTGVARSPVVR